MFTMGIVALGKGTKNDNMQIGSVIRLIRKAKKLTLEDLAHNAGTTASYLSRIEMDKNNLSPELLDNIAAALEVSVADIYAEAEKQLDRKQKNTHFPTFDTLSKTQALLLADYESLSMDGKELVDVLIKTLKRQSSD